MTKDEFLANSRGIIAAIYKKFEADRVTAAPLIWEQRDQQTQTEQINIQHFSDNLPSLAQVMSHSERMTRDDAASQEGTFTQLLLDVPQEKHQESIGSSIGMSLNALVSDPPFSENLPFLSNPPLSTHPVEYLSSATDGFQTAPTLHELQTSKEQHSLAANAQPETHVFGAQKNCYLCHTPCMHVCVECKVPTHGSVIGCSSMIDEGTFKCFQCSEVSINEIPNPSKANHSTNLNNEKSKKSDACPHCGKRFQQNYNLKRHIENACGRK